MIKNDLYDIDIVDIGNDGEGIGHVNDKQNGRSMAVFVKDTVIGDKARIRIVKVKKTYAYGRLEELIEPSAYRANPACENARSCGGCSLMHMSYEKQLEYKANKVKSCLERIGGIENASEIMEEAHGMEIPYNYRNKMQLPVGRDKNGNIVIGFYAGRTHSIINLNKCHIGHGVNDYIIKYMREWLALSEGICAGDIVYREEGHSGLVRHILTRVGYTTGELMVCIIINGDRLPKGSEDTLVEACRRAVIEYNMSRNNDCDGAGIADNTTDIKLTSVSININKEKTNRILGDKCKTVWGSPYIEDYIGDVRFRISPMSFYQVNPVQTKAIYDKAIEFAGLTGNEVVWDMYCGIGTISLSMARSAKKVYGVEIVPQAIADAKENARINGIDNAEFFCGKAEEVVPEFYDTYNMSDETRSEGTRPDVIVVDPPRKGCDSALLSTISAMSPRRLVYVSCDPATLARDVKLLQEQGFCLKQVAVFDAFCHSGHVETVALLSRMSN